MKLIALLDLVPRPSRFGLALPFVCLTSSGLPQRMPRVTSDSRSTCFVALICEKAVR